MQIFIIIVAFLSLSLENGLNFVQYASAAEDVYDGCGTTRFCFGQPEDGCVKKKSCKIVSSFLLDKSSHKLNVKIQGEIPESKGWIGIGFSSDDKMGSDLCFICVKIDDQAYHFHNWNTDGYDSKYLDPKDIKSGADLTLKKSSHTDKQFSCELESSSIIEYKGTYDFSKTKYHIMMALGSGDGVSDRKIIQHSARFVSAEPLSLVESKTVETKQISKSEEASKLLYKAHGILMVIGFMFFLSLGVFVARFYKQTFIEVQVCGRRFWFVGHMTCMYCAVTCVFTALIIILIARSKNGAPLIPTATEKSLMNHAYVGFTACVLMLSQSTFIWWSPSFRKTITLIHSLLGFFTFYFGWYCITFSRKDTHRGPENIFKIGIAWICFYLLSVIGMSSLLLWDDRKEDPEAYSYDAYRAFKVPMKITSSGEDPSKTARIVALGFLVCVFLILMAYAIAEIFNSTFDKQL